jgi:hypothetical protein
MYYIIIYEKKCLKHIDMKLHDYIEHILNNYSKINLI